LSKAKNGQGEVEDSAAGASAKLETRQQASRVRKDITGDTSIKSSIPASPVNTGETGHQIRLSCIALATAPERLWTWSLP
jgi:hypothetical protein